MISIVSIQPFGYWIQEGHVSYDFIVYLFILQLDLDFYIFRETIEYFHVYLQDIDIENTIIKLCLT